VLFVDSCVAGFVVVQHVPAVISNFVRILKVLLLKKAILQSQKLLLSTVLLDKYQGQRIFENPNQGQKKRS